MLGHGAFEDRRHIRGCGPVADEGGDGTEVGVALVEGAAYPVGDGVGTVALVVDELLRYDGGVPGAVEQQHHRGGPDQQQDAAAGQQRAGADAPPMEPLPGVRTALARTRTRTCARTFARSAAGGEAAEQLEPEPFQRVADPPRLAEPGHGHRPGEIPAGEAAALHDEPEQRALDRTEQQGHRERPDDEQRGGGPEAEQRVAGPAGVLGDGHHGDHEEAEPRGVGAPARLGRRECRVPRDRALAADQRGAGRGPADPGVAAGTGFPCGEGVLPGCSGGALRQGTELLLGPPHPHVGGVRVVLLGRLRAVAAEDRTARVGHGDRPELAEADPGHVQAVGGDQQLLGQTVPRQQGEDEQPGLTVLQPDQPGGETALVGEALQVDGEERDVLAARGEQSAGLDLDDGRTAPLLVDAAELVEDGVGGDRGARVEEGRGPFEVGDRFVQ
ncbi:hypothetical protein CU044_7145 [Streptomyces sp. L-9-10]|nr:hypothetical protein CU044_7145 [Streptomyces sp. L-9-10]